MLKDTVAVDIFKEVDVEDFEGTVSEQDAELNDFRKKIEISTLCNETFSFISSYKISWKSFL